MLKTPVCTRQQVLYTLTHEKKNNHVLGEYRDTYTIPYPVNIGDWTFHVHGFVSEIIRVKKTQKFVIFCQFFQLFVPGRSLHSFVCRQILL